MRRAEVLYAQALPPPCDENALLKEHASLLDRVARRLAHRVGRADLAEELWSAGALALLDAWHRYDGARGARFTTFAEHRIKGAMLDELRRLDPVPRRLRDDARALSRTKDRLTQTLGRAPDACELAEASGHTAEDLAALEVLDLPPVALTAELPVPTGAQGADELFVAAEERAQLGRAVAQLPSRLQELLSLRYVEALTLREVGQVLGVTEARVCQLHAEALRLLRAAVGH